MSASHPSPCPLPYSPTRPPCPLPSLPPPDPLPCPQVQAWVSDAMAGGGLQQGGAVSRRELLRVMVARHGCSGEEVQVRSSSRLPRAALSEPSKEGTASERGFPAAPASGCRLTPCACSLALAPSLPRCRMSCTGWRRGTPSCWRATRSTCAPEGAHKQQQSKLDGTRAQQQRRSSSADHSTAAPQTASTAQHTAPPPTLGSIEVEQTRLAVRRQQPRQQRRRRQQHTLGRAPQAAATVE